MVRVIEVLEEEESDVEDDEDIKMDDIVKGYWFRFLFLYFYLIDYFLIYDMYYVIYFL